MAGNNQIVRGSVNGTKDNVEQIMDLLAEGEEFMKNNTRGQSHENVTLVLGNTGGGKSTFSLWIADANLTSIEDPTSPGEYTIIDDQGRIGNDTIQSQTTFPELIVNNNTGATFYDFPGFKDTRGVANDIAITYFIKKAVDMVERIKMIFIVKYDSLTSKGVRNDFTDFLTAVCHLVPNMDKFTNSIGLIASRVDKDKVPDEKLINGIGIFMNETKITLEEKEKDEKVDYTREIKLLEALLSKAGEGYPNIGLFRAPNEPGPLDNMTMLVENKRHITKMLQQFHFIEKTEDDFGYTIPKQSLSDVDDIIYQIDGIITKNIKESGKQIQKHLSDKENEFHDVFELRNKTFSDYEKLYQLKTEADACATPEQCVQKLVDGWGSMNIGPTPQNLIFAQKNSSFSSFLQQVSDHPDKVPLKCTDGLTDVIDYAKKTTKWYQFLIDLYHKFSYYNIQQNVIASPCYNLTDYIAQGEVKENNSTVILQSIPKECLPSEGYDIEGISNLILDKPKRDTFGGILYLTMKDNSSSSSCDDNGLVVKGQYITLSSVQNFIKVNCTVPPKSTQIFALNKVFVDTNLNVTGDSILFSIISPWWDIQGGQTLMLDGAGGRAQPKAGNGVSPGEHGKDGKQGLPGGQGGNFLGIGENLNNIQDLTVSVNGGQGGVGQEGGDGATGKTGLDASNDLWYDTTIWSIFDIFGEVKSKYHKIYSDILIRNNYETNGLILSMDRRANLVGFDGDSGGNGGNGGNGGEPGNPGNVTFIPVPHENNNMQPKVENSVGNKGLGGTGGKRGLGGSAGLNMEIPYTITSTTLETYNQKLVDPTGKNGPSGRSGNDGKDSVEVEGPKNKEPDYSDIVTSYEKYLIDNLNGSVVESQLKQFLFNIQNSYNIKGHQRRRRYADTHSDYTRYNDQNTAKNSHFATNAANRFNSPINSAVNLMTNFIGQLAIFHIAKTNYHLIRDGIESIFGNWKQSNIHTTANDYHNLASNVTKFNVNESLVLADFAIRYVTKAKPYNSEEQPMNFSEVKASALGIIEKFEQILSDLFVQYDLPAESLQFDPVTLMSNVEKEIIAHNYTKIGALLIRSLVNNSNLNDTQIYNYVQGKIDEVLVSQGQNKVELSYNRVEDNDTYLHASDVGKAMTTENGFNYISYQSRVNYLQSLE